MATVVAILAQRHAFDELDGQIRFTGFRLSTLVDFRDVGMPQSFHGLGFDFKTLESFGGDSIATDQFNGNHTIGFGVPGGIDFTKTTFAQKSAEFLAADDLADAIGQVSFEGVFARRLGILRITKQTIKRCGIGRFLIFWPLVVVVWIHRHLPLINRFHAGRTGSRFRLWQAWRL